MNDPILPVPAKLGRPAVMTDSVVDKLLAAYAVGASDLEAAYYAGVSRETVNKHAQRNPDFFDRKIALKKRPVLLARAVITDALLSGDVASAHKVLDRHDGIKQVISGDPDSPVTHVHRIELVPLASQPIDITGVVGNG